MNEERFLVAGGRRPGDDDEVAITRALGDTFATSRLLDAIQWARNFDFMCRVDLLVSTLRR